MTLLDEMMDRHYALPPDEPFPITRQELEEFKQSLGQWGEVKTILGRPIKIVGYITFSHG